MFAEMAERARKAFVAYDIEAEPLFEPTLEMRYVGQAFEIQVPLDAAALDSLTTQELAARFAEAHIRLFGFGGAEFGPCEIVSFRIGALAPPSQMPALREEDTVIRGADTKIFDDGADTKIFDDGAWRDCALRGRTDIRAASELAGPLLIEDATSTAYVPQGWRASVDSYDNLIIRQEEGKQ